MKGCFSIVKYSKNLSAQLKVKYEDEQVINVHLKMEQLKCLAGYIKMQVRYST
jgi:hypothetical protein